MKIRKVFQVSIILIIVIFSVQFLFAQVEFEGKEILAELNSYGEIELFTLHGVGDDIDTLYQIDRITPLLGTSNTEVLAYREDIDDDRSPEIIDPPEYGDGELASGINNFYSFEPPDALIGINIYGWQDQNFVIIKYTIQNNGEESYDARFGFEIIPEVADAYGFESIEYYPEEDVIDIYKSEDSSHVGLKFLSHPLSTLNSIVWYDGYDGSDSLLWNYLTHDKIDTLMVSNSSDGTVTLPSIDPITYPPSESIDFYMAMSWGKTKTECLDQISSANAAYETFQTGVKPNETTHPNEFILNQNYPNPFNPQTNITFTIPHDRYTTLSIYNANGQLVNKLVDKKLSAGNYRYLFDGQDFSSGIYFYHLQSGNFHSSKKMLLLK